MLAAGGRGGLGEGGRAGCVATARPLSCFPSLSFSASHMRGRAAISGSKCDYLRIFAFKCKYPLPATVIGRQVRNRGGIGLDMAETGSQQEAGDRGGGEALLPSFLSFFSLALLLLPFICGAGGKQRYRYPYYPARPRLSRPCLAPPAARRSPGWHIPARIPCLRLSSCYVHSFSALK